MRVNAFVHSLTIRQFADYADSKTAALRHALAGAILIDALIY